MPIKTLLRSFVHFSWVFVAFILHTNYKFSKCVCVATKICWDSKKKTLSFEVNEEKKVFWFTENAHHDSVHHSNMKQTKLMHIEDAAAWYIF